MSELTTPAPPADGPTGRGRVRPGTGTPTRAALTLGALGVVFGDIGTSPIYTLQTLFSPDDPHPVPLTEPNLLGLLSLIFWSATVVVTGLYVGVVLRADNHGEGGIMSLITLVGRPGRDGRRLPARVVRRLALAGIAGAALFLADSMITPAISVLSAVEGVTVVDPGLGGFVVPAVLVIVVALFAVQRFGTAKVGAAFGPVMVLWFLTIGLAGLSRVVQEPGVLRALSPTYAVGFFLNRPGTAFFALAAVVLVITGAEALYADLGHFGRAPITRAWLFLVYPACMLSYFGQGALVVGDLSPDGPITAPFFRVVPSWALVPLVVLATLATVIASQAVITGAFSVVRQAVQLGYLPRLRIVHTSAHTIGQVYVPFVNYALMVAVVLLVLAFGSSAALAFAYGMAVTCTVLVTIVLVSVLAVHRWGWPRPAVLAGAAFVGLVMLGFLAANLTKLAHGAWVPLVIAVVLVTVMTTWARGRRLVTARRQEQEGPLADLLHEVCDPGAPVVRVPGTAVYLNRAATDAEPTAPLAMRSTVEHLHALHERVLIVSLTTAPTPWVVEDEVGRVAVPEGSDGSVVLVTLHFGYRQRTDVPTALAEALGRADVDVDVADASWFLSTIDVSRAPGRHRGRHDLPRWRRAVFTATAHLTTDVARSFELPRDRTVVLGARIEV
ncbi:KUP system potassium uptake protein [Klenkia soli]|uniref:Probable potassium transport system protein Kup n=1 Tax=Klenkia soli TaxID=1052260 RepID=A0A1H0FU16_9ACTN|nr:KUP/HAK/KT family potassium transporter [Klenkia soli]SDN98130.1 KUP system potassium uptake protein [Klenkia soli]